MEKEKLCYANMSDGSSILIGSPREAISFLKKVANSTERKIIITRGGAVNPAYLVTITEMVNKNKDINNSELYLTLEDFKTNRYKLNNNYDTQN